MNILIMISNPPFDGIFGGAENFVRNISIELSKRGHNIHILCRKVSGSLPEYEKLNDGVNVHRFSFLKIPKFTWLYTMPRSMLQKGMKIVEKFDIDLIYCIELYPTGWVGVKIGKIYNLPVILSLRNVHTYYLNILSDLPSPIRKIVEKRIQWCLNGADRIHAVSMAVKKNYIYKFNLPEQKINVIPNGIDVEKFKPSEKEKVKLRFRKELVNHYPIIVYPARFDKKQKRHDVVIETIKILKENYKYNPFAYLIGNGDPGYIIKDIKSSNLENSFFVGKILHEKIINVYLVSDLCLFPTNYEGFSMALLEVVASGLPVIATDLPEIREIVDESNGILIKKNDPNLFAEAVVKLCEDKTLLNKKSKNSRKKALKYSWDRVAEKVENMLIEVVENPRS